MNVVIGLTIFFCVIAIVFLILVLVKKRHTLFNNSNISGFHGVNKKCKNYVDRQSKCFCGKPDLTAHCFEHNAWAKKARKCVDKVQKECRKNCPSVYCPAPIYPEEYVGC